MNFLRKQLQSHVKFVGHWSDSMANLLTKLFGSLWFLNVNLFFILLWVAANYGLVTGFHPFDPYPFNLLMIIVQLSAILLSTIVLISQNRQSRNADIRQQIDLEINVRAEHEITKILTMLEEIHRELGIAKKDQELEEMKEKTDITEIKEEVEHIVKEEKR